MKNYYLWHLLKTKINAKEKRAFFKEREVWWCSIGCNVGDEVDGKNKYFERPVLVLRQFNNKVFWAIPLTTKNKDNPYYFQLKYKGTISSAVISQLRLMDSKRLIRKMRMLTQDEYQQLIENIVEILQKKRSLVMRDLGARRRLYLHYT